jgi:hypothetical protein
MKMGKTGIRPYYKLLENCFVYRHWLVLLVILVQVKMMMMVVMVMMMVMVILFNFLLRMLRYNQACSMF